MLQQIVFLLTFFVNHVFLRQAQPFGLWKEKQLFPMSF